MCQRREQRLVQELITPPTVEGFNEAVLHRLAQRDVELLDLGRVRPARHRDDCRKTP